MITERGEAGYSAGALHRTSAPCTLLEKVCTVIGRDRSLHAVVVEVGPAEGEPGQRERVRLPGAGGGAPTGEKAERAVSTNAWQASSEYSKLFRN